MGTLRGVDLACRRGDRVVFQGLQFSLGAGELAWLRGRNGSGKSSLLRLAAGLASPLRGELTWDDAPLARSEAFRRTRRFIGHANGLQDELTVGESLAFCAALAGAPGARIVPALRAFGLESLADAPVRTLSQGQRRRAALATLGLSEEPGVWLLDEPFDALDAEAAQRLQSLIASHRARGGSVLLAAHGEALQVPPTQVIDLSA